MPDYINQSYTNILTNIDNRSTILKISSLAVGHNNHRLSDYAGLT